MTLMSIQFISVFLSPGGTLLCTFKCLVPALTFTSPPELQNTFPELQRNQKLGIHIKCAGQGASRTKVGKHWFMLCLFVYVSPLVMQCIQAAQGYTQSLCSPTSHAGNSFIRRHHAVKDCNFIVLNSSRGCGTG